MKSIGAGILAPMKSDLNTDMGLIKLFAMLLMLCDHIGAQLFPQYRVMRCIGRVAFPLYAYGIASGCVYTKNTLRYLKRVVLLGLISQPFYAHAMAHTVPAMYAVKFSERPIAAVFNYYVNSWNHPSILFTLALGIVVIWTIRNRHFILTAGLALLIWRMQTRIDYGWIGVLLIVLFYLTIGHRWLAIPAMTAYMIWWGMRSSGYELFGIQYGIQAFTVFALPLIFIRTKSGIRLPKWFAYGFYPGSMVLIILLKALFK